MGWGGVEGACLWVCLCVPFLLLLPRFLTPSTTHTTTTTTNQSITQAVLLLSFDAPSLDFAALKERVNAPVEQMKPLLHSLSCGKYKVSPAALNVSV